MGKKIGIFVFFVAICFCLMGITLAEEATQTSTQEEQVTIKGVVQEIAEDGSYIVVEGQKILTNKEFIEDAFLALDDKIEVIAVNTPEGLKAVDCNYIFEEEISPSNLQE
ncbi:MAG: hypothetical protein NC822_04060 [Candidatus Omnitrophica bacterium]|nr:hypothetical protein [Candidatus Omnitrophota bacterium]MCM8826776.1 hypothetical protein [Candidatus Omnitrophota bacterium]